MTPERSMKTELAWWLGQAKDPVRVAVAEDLNATTNMSAAGILAYMDSAPLLANSYMYSIAVPVLGRIVGEC